MAQVEVGPFIGVIYVLKMDFFAKKSKLKFFWVPCEQGSQIVLIIPIFRNLLTNTDLLEYGSLNCPYLRLETSKLELVKRFREFEILSKI